MGDVSQGTEKKSSLPEEKAQAGTEELLHATAIPKCSLPLIRLSYPIQRPLIE
jgi:hypothetical protein